MDKKFFVFLLMGIFLISFAAASVDFSEEDDIYVIDTIWPTWLGGDGQSIVKMIDNTDHCLIDCSFTLEFNNEEPVNLLEEISFVNDQGEDVSENIETIKFSIGNYQDVEKSRKVYELVCEEIPLNATNGTEEVCNNNEVGEETYYENELVWNDYTGEQVEGLNYLRATGKKKINNRADWVITFRGEDLVRWAWWDAGWEFRREITITENSGSSLTDYSTLIKVPYDAHMQTDFDDLRFSNSGGTAELGYWIENKTNSDHAYIWVKVPSVSASSTASIYLYYGNSGASNGENIQEAFIFADDFDDASINTTKWDYTVSGAVESGGTIHVYDTREAWYHLKSDDTFDEANYRIRSYMKVDGTNDKISTLGKGDNSGNPAYYFYNDGDIFYGGSGGATGIAYDTNWHLTEATNYDDKGSIFTDHADTWINVTSPSSTGRYIYVGDLKIYGGSGGVEFDWITYGHYVYSEPTFSIGSEETSYGSIDVGFVTPPTPVNYANVSGAEITIEVQANYTDASLTNISYDFYNVNGTLITDFFTNETYQTNITLPDAHYHYNVTICGTETVGSTDICSSTATQHLNHDTIAPTITPPTNLTDLITLTLPTNSTWSFNATDVHLDSCYYSTSEQNSTVITCNSTIETSWATQGNKTITSCANDTFGFETCQTDYIWVYYLAETQSVNIDPVGEGTEVEFSLLINLTDIPSTSAYLVLNNTNYAATTSIAGINAYYFQSDVVIPDGWGNSTGNVLDWNWVYNVSGIVTNEETDTDNITVYALAVDDCSLYGDVILNLSLKDEETDDYLFPPTTNSTDVQVDLQIFATDNASLSWDYSNTWDDDADGIIQVCVPTGVLNNSEYKIEFVMGYSAEDYVQEFYYLDNGTLNADKQYNSLTTDQINLYDLALDDSTTFLFKFFDEDNIEVKDGVVHTFRKYIGDGEFREVERSKSDNNGETHVHLVEEDVIYYFKISLESEILFTSASYSAKCLSTPCQIDLEASGEFEEFDNNWDLANGSYDVSSDAGTRQVSMLYSLENPQTMNLTVMRYTNNPDTMEVVGSDEAYSTGGILSVTVPQVAGNVSFIAVVYEDGEVIDTEWVDFSPSGSDYFGATGIFMALLLIICLILMGSSEGEGTLIFAIIGLILISSLKLIDLDYYALIGFICAAAILVWKISERRKR